MPGYIAGVPGSDRDIRNIDELVFSYVVAIHKIEL